MLAGVWFLTSSNDTLVFPAGSLFAVDASGEYFNTGPECATLGNLSVSGNDATYAVLYPVPLGAQSCGVKQRAGAVFTGQYGLTGNTLKLQQGISVGIFQREF